MDSFDYVVTFAFVALAAFQIWLTVRVFRSTMYERKQQIWQAQLIWLLPILGAGLVFAALRNNETETRKSDDRPTKMSS